VAAHRDGFKLAEIDLELRGEGELTGVRQHGSAGLRVAELPRDARVLERAAACAPRLLEADPELQEPETALLGRALADAYGAEAGAPIRA
jgi:ATP-dependent DNA helicase RecG